MKYHSEEPIVSSETSAIRTQTPGNYPKRNNLHLEHGESLRTRLYLYYFCVVCLYSSGVVYCVFESSFTASCCLKGLLDVCMCVSWCVYKNFNVIKNTGG